MFLKNANSKHCYYASYRIYRYLRRVGQQYSIKLCVKITLVYGWWKNKFQKYLIASALRKKKKLTLKIISSRTDMYFMYKICAVEILAQLLQLNDFMNESR